MSEQALKTFGLVLEFPFDSFKEELQRRGIKEARVSATRKMHPSAETMAEFAVFFTALDGHILRCRYQGFSEVAYLKDAIKEKWDTLIDGSKKAEEELRALGIAVYEGEWKWEREGER